MLHWYLWGAIHCNGWVTRGLNHTEVPRKANKCRGRIVGRKEGGKEGRFRGDRVVLFQWAPVFRRMVRMRSDRKERRNSPILPTLSFTEENNQAFMKLRWPVISQSAAWNMTPLCTHPTNLYTVTVGGRVGERLEERKNERIVHGRRLKHPSFH